MKEKNELCQTLESCITDDFLQELAFGRYKGAPESWVKAIAYELLMRRTGWADAVSACRSVQEEEPKKSSTVYGVTRL